MPGQQEVRWSQLKVGVLVLVAVCALIALVFLMSGASGGFWSGHLKLISYFENSAGLKNGAPVNLDGVTVGNVTAIRIDPGKPLTPVEVVMKVNAERANDIRADSKSSLETMGVLGDTVVDIDSRNATGPPVQNGAVLPTTETPNLQDVIQASQGTIEQLDTILGKVSDLVDSLNSNKGSIGMLINNRELYDKGLKTLNELSGLVDEVSNGQGSLGKLLKEDTLYDNLKQATTGLNQIVTRVNSGQGSIGKLMKDDSLYNNMNQATKNLNELLTNINAGRGSLGMLAKNPLFAEKLTDTVNQMDSILKQINQGRGTIGQLIKNREFYDNANQTMQQAKGLMTAIRRNPKKYLTIHMKVF
ncbi:MAG TPA: MlaD family protein [Acidobacteriaceae bacterium]|nr:MlaD family protein [Acidobacteriaceae bacterium]